MQNISDYSTYKAAILQARAYRNLRNFMVRVLKNYDLTSTEWSILGTISDEAKNGGIRISQLAKLLDVETSFVTNMAKKLIKRDLATYAYDEDDGRVRLLIATDKAHLKVIEIESKLRKEMRLWLEDVDHKQLAIYINVLGKISTKTF